MRKIAWNMYVSWHINSKKASKKWFFDVKYPDDFYNEIIDSDETIRLICKL